MSPDEATGESQRLLYQQKVLREEGMARDSTLRATNSSLGGDGPTPPAITGTGVRGWLRAIFEKLPLAGAIETALGAIFTRQGDGTQKTQVTNFPATQAVNGPLTNTELRAAAVATNDSGLPDTLGQKNAAGSTSVVLASDQAAVPVSGPLTDTQLRATPIPVAVTSSATTPSTNAVVTAIGSSTSAVAVLAANAARKSASYFNDSSQVCYLKSGAAASASSYTVKIPPQGYYEMQLPIYVGAVTAAWAAVDGNLLVTEYT